MMDFKKIIISHPTGNQNVHSLVKGLYERKILNFFFTCIAINDQSYIFKFKKFGIVRELEKRSISSFLIKYVNTQPFYELSRLLAQKISAKKLTEHEKGIFCIDNVYRRLDSKVAFNLRRVDCDAIYAYEDGAKLCFLQAKQSNIKCLYDLPIGYWRAMRDMLKTEKDNRPEWADTLTGFKDSSEKLERKDEELALADVIFVASSFTKNTLKYYPGKLPLIKVVPYGFPTTHQKKYQSLRNRKLKLLFVGGLSQRKGIANIFEAYDALSDFVELTVIGKKPVDDCEILNISLEKINWIPSLPHKEILKKMAETDILVFPSLFEGYGLVITEAMSQGTPVVTTNRTIGGDIIDDGVNGWLVEPGNTKDLISKLTFIINNPEIVRKVGENALDTAKKLPIEGYGLRMVKELENLKAE